LISQETKEALKVVKIEKKETLVKKEVKVAKVMNRKIM